MFSYIKEPSRHHNYTTKSTLTKNIIQNLENVLAKNSFCPQLSCTCMHAEQVRPCDCVIMCNNLPWRWTLFCISISYVTSKPKGQKLMVDEIACNFLPPTTFTMLLNTHTHCLSPLCTVMPSPSVNKHPFYP